MRDRGERPRRRGSVDVEHSAALGVRERTNAVRGGQPLERGRRLAAAAQDHQRNQPRQRHERLGAGALRRAHEPDRSARQARLVERGPQHLVDEHRTVPSAAPPVRSTTALPLFNTCDATSTATFGRASKFAPTTPTGIRRSETSSPVRQPPRLAPRARSAATPRRTQPVGDRLEPPVVETQPVERAGVEPPLGRPDVGRVGLQHFLASLVEEPHGAPERLADQLVASSPAKRLSRRSCLLLDELERRHATSGARERAPQPDEERLERELRVEVELLQRAPHLAHELRGASRRRPPARAWRPRAARRAGRRGRPPPPHPPRRRPGRGTTRRAPRARRAAPRARRRAARAAPAAPPRAPAGRCPRAPPPLAPSPPPRRARARSEHDRGRLARLELRIGVGRPRDPEQRARAARAASGSSSRSRPVEPAAATRASAVARSRDSPGARSARNSRTRPLGQPPERHELAARADRRRQRPELVRDEHDDGVRRRLLEILQQRVGRVLVQQVRRRSRRRAARASNGRMCRSRRSSRISSMRIISPSGSST